MKFEMSKCVEKSAKTVDEAVKLALAELGLDRDNVEIEVIEEGSRGLFGLGAKDAVVKVTPNINLEGRAREFLDNVFVSMGLRVDANDVFQHFAVKKFNNCHRVHLHFDKNIGHSLKDFALCETQNNIKKP